MKNLNDLIKPDELVNDMSILQDMSYSSKGPEALGESSTKNVILKMFYRNTDLNFCTNTHYTILSSNLQLQKGVRVINKK